MTLAVSIRNLAMQYGRRLVFQELSFDLSAGQAAGVVGPNGSGKTTLLRAVAGCLAPRSGEIRINGLTPRDAIARTGIGYFAGEATLPGSVRATNWGSLGAGDHVTLESRRLRSCREAPDNFLVCGRCSDAIRSGSSSLMSHGKGSIRMQVAGCRRCSRRSAIAAPLSCCRRTGCTISPGYATSTCFSSRTM